MRPTYISIFVFVLFLLLGQNVLSSFNINENRFQFLMMAFSLVPGSYFSYYWKNKISYLWLMSYLLLFSAYKLVTDTGEGTRTFLMTIIASPVIIAAFPAMERFRSVLSFRRMWKNIWLIFVFFYLFETLMAIYERISGHMVFGWSSINNMTNVVDIGDYRSTALYGHPLYNALMVSTAMTFILTSKLRPAYKFLLWGIGFGAILCFNTRGSIVANSLILGLYVLYTILLNRRVNNSTKTSVMLAGAAVASIGYIVLNTGYVGGRLLKMGLIDESSAQVRIDAMDFVMGRGLTSFLFGMNYHQYTDFLYVNRIPALENFWLEYLMRFGLIFLIGYVLFYFFFLKSEMKNYKLFDKLLICGSFILIASTNNSLSTSFIALLYFFILIRLFNPASFKKIVDKKYRI